MKILYTSDLHGKSWKYDQLQIEAQKHCVAMVINGGDMLPVGKSLFDQDKFIVGYLQDHLKSFDKIGVHYLCFPGNDDLIAFDPLFNEVCQKYELVHNIAQQKTSINNFEFIGINWVPDYPFRLKDRCRVDNQKFVFERQFGSALLSTLSGWKKIEHWQTYAQSLPTIEEELKNLPLPDSMEKAIYVIHAPPAFVGLDVCTNGKQVGSKAVYDFLERYQPLMSLHGHIHESPEMSGVWKSTIGETICIQPGQLNPFTYVMIDTETMDIKKYDVNATY